MRSSEYTIILYNTSGVKQAVFDTSAFQFAEFTHDCNGMGSFQITLKGDDERIPLFGLDYIINVRRRNKLYGLDWYTEWEGLKRDELRTTGENGEKLYTAVAVGYNHLLKRRHILYPEKTAYSAKNDVGESVMKAYVNENAGPGATNPPRTQGQGVITGLTIAADTAVGGIWEGDRAGRNLLDVLVEIATSSRVDFDVIGTNIGEFEFRTYEFQRGVNRSTVGLSAVTALNSFGNVPVIFIPKNDTMTAIEYTLSRSSEITRVIVNGKGEGASRMSVTVDNAAAIIESPWNQIETVVTSSQESETDALTNIGEVYLYDYGAREDLSFQALQQPSALYGLHYSWGDIISARYDEKYFDKKINSVTIRVDESGETINPEFIDVN